MAPAARPAGAGAGTDGRGAGAGLVRSLRVALRPGRFSQGEGGGIVAAPIFGEFMKEAIGNDPAVPFRAPSGIRLVRVNAKTGKPAQPGETNVILEAFKAEDDIENGGSRFSINGVSVDEGLTDEGIDDDLGGLY